MTTARSGRRPGNPATRDAILDAARASFADTGYDRTSIRSIAAAAQVDPALVHHYFGTKRELFAAAINLPIDPGVILDALAAVPVEQLGERLVLVAATAWDSTAGPQFIAAFRSIVGGGQVELIRNFMVSVVFNDIGKRVDSPVGSGSTRIGLAASHMMGLLVGRKIIGLEPVASMTPHELSRVVGPAIQRYLTGDLAI